MQTLCIAVALGLEGAAAAWQPWVAVALVPVLTLLASRLIAAPRGDAAGLDGTTSDAIDARPGNASELERSVAAHAPGLPILAEQLRATAADVEDSVITVCTSFQGMATRARAVVDELQLRIGAGTEPEYSGAPGMAELIRGARGRLDTALLRVIEGSATSDLVLARMSDAAERIAEVGRAAEQVEGIAEKTKLLALNARIEAVHAGKHGLGFTVVAGEVKELAEQATQTSQAVRALVSGITATFDEVRSGVETLAAATGAAAEQTRHEVENAMSDLERTHEGLQETVGHALDGSRQLAGDIASAVIGLQFQDAVNQRLHHVVDALGQAERALVEHLPAGAAPTTTPWLDELQSSYTMAAERQVLAQHTGDSHAEQGSAPGSIELF
jgi:methyl-accepting chemotaxis protein